ncbi:MAG: hypothetical protein J0M07_12345 [Anaerolineae bacterium]|nr:hypothetical protein [Anaerolineae bacterium]
MATPVLFMRNGARATYQIYGIYVELEPLNDESFYQLLGKPDWEELLAYAVVTGVDIAHSQDSANFPERCLKVNGGTYKDFKWHWKRWLGNEIASQVAQVAIKENPDYFVSSDSGS